MVVLVFALSAALAGCASHPDVVSDTWVAEDPTEAAIAERERALIVATAEAEVFGLQQALDCRELLFGLYVCPTEAALENWAWEHHLREPAENSLVSTLTPADPTQIRDGVELMTLLLQGPARATRAHLDLLEHTPVHNPFELAYFEDHPAVWESLVGVRGADAGRDREAALNAALDRHSGSRQATRALVLRDGYLFFEDSRTAAYAVRNLGLRDLFDEDEIVLERGGRRFHLDRSRSGHYYHTDADFAGYRGRLNLMDRVGLDEQLGPAPTYNLQRMRRRLGIEHIEAGDEGGAGREAQVAFLDGSSFQGRLVRADRGAAELGIVAEFETARRVVSRSQIVATSIYGATDVVFEMVRENLFFDEPANEVGQQDGIMRLAYSEASRRGQLEYTVNEVTYPLYDERGRPRPPQVCIDFITDAIERYRGSWWPPANSGSTRRTRGQINMRHFMRYRQVRQLVGLGESHPWLVSVLSYPRREQVPFRERSAFFDAIWERRDDFRIGDVVVIYGLRSDNRNHYHSFFVYDTDPVFGVPTALADQAGHARIRSWENIMRTAPLRSIRNRVRFNPYWINQPVPGRRAGEVWQQAANIAEAMLIPELPAAPEAEPSASR